MEDFCREYHDTEVATLTRHQQYPIEGYVSDQLHHQGQCDSGQRRDGLNLPQRSTTMVRVNPDHNLHPGEATVFF